MPHILEDYKLNNLDDIYTDQYKKSTDNGTPKCMQLAYRLHQASAAMQPKTAMVHVCA